MLAQNNLPSKKKSHRAKGLLRPGAKGLTKKDVFFLTSVVRICDSKNHREKTTCGFTFANQPNHSVMVSNQQKKEAQTKGKKRSIGNVIT